MGEDCSIGEAARREGERLQVFCPACFSLTYRLSQRRRLESNRSPMNLLFSPFFILLLYYL